MIASGDPPTSIEGLVNDYLPAWQAADVVLPDAERAASRAGFNRLRDAFAAWLAANPDARGGEILGVVATLREVAAANGFGDVGIDAAPLWQALRTPNGGFASSPGAPIPDPHTTADAQSVGAPSTELGLPFFASRATPAGWPADQDVDPCSTYVGVTVDHLVGDHSHDLAVTPVVAAWLAQLSDTVTPATVCVVAVGGELSIPRPGDLDAALRAAAERVQATTTDPAEAAMSAELLHLLGATTTASRAPAPASAGIDARLLCIATSISEADVQSCPLASPLALDNGTYRTSDRAPIADLRSTAIGWLGRVDDAGRARALESFRRDGQTWMLPVGTAPNVTSLESLYFGLVLAGVVTAPAHF